MRFRKFLYYAYYANWFQKKCPKLSETFNSYKWIDSRFYFFVELAYLYSYYLSFSLYDLALIPLFITFIFVLIFLLMHFAVKFDTGTIWSMIFN